MRKASKTSILVRSEVNYKSEEKWMKEKTLNIDKKAIEYAIDS